MTEKRPKLSRTSAMHAAKLVFRSSLFLAVLAVYVPAKLRGTEGFYEVFAGVPWLLPFIWTAFMADMLKRMLIPGDIESMGSQKLFRKNYRPSGEHPGHVTVLSPVRTAVTAGSWFLLNGIIFLLYFRGILDEGAMLLISLFYSMSDMICILFFCPFQTWMMENRCCTTCRIYNWDFPMMFTPMAVSGHFFQRSLFLVSMIVLIQWEVQLHLHPEYFSEQTNESLRCVNCTEKLCRHKKQLHSFWRRLRKAGKQI